MFTYLVWRLWDGISGFVQHWYADGFKAVAGTAVEFFYRLDKIFAVKVNLKLLFTPLYQDRSFIGYVLGFLFRSFRVLIGGVIYIFLGFVSACAYIAWGAIPVFLLYKAITGII